jgi:hypothetical protein
MMTLKPENTVRPVLEKGEFPVGVRGLSEEQILVALDRFEKLVNDSGHKRESGARIPRANEMRPYRFCVQDVVMAIWAMGHRKDEADIHVEVFMTSEVYDGHTGERGFFEPLAGATAAMLTILSEAYRVGCPMAVSFGPCVEPTPPTAEAGKHPEPAQGRSRGKKNRPSYGRVPLDVMALAAGHGVEIANPDSGKISAQEGRQLYLALTGFRPFFREAIEELHALGLMSPERAAYIVHHGVWSLPEVEGIILCSQYPDLVLSGDVMPENRHLYQHVLNHTRLALMGGLLDRSLASRQNLAPVSGPERSGAPEKSPKSAAQAFLDVEDDDRNLDIRTNAALLGREYVLVSHDENETMPLPEWGVPGDDFPALKPGQRLSVLLRPRTASSLGNHFQADMAQARARVTMEPLPEVVALAVPFDFHDLTQDKQSEIRDCARENGVLLLICPESTRSFDQMGQSKLEACRIKQE